MSFIARLEYKHGFIVEGRAAYEKLIQTSKIDIILHYLDCEEQVADVNYIRELFKRLTERDFGSRRNKILGILLKRWLTIEKQIGDAAHIGEIKLLAEQLLE